MFLFSLSSARESVAVLMLANLSGGSSLIEGWDPLGLLLPERLLAWLSPLCSWLLSIDPILGIVRAGDGSLAVGFDSGGINDPCD
jgi:hypothetical protein